MPGQKRRKFLIRKAQKRRTKRAKANPTFTSGAFVEHRLNPILELRAKTGARIPKNHPAILGVGGAQIVVDLGRARIGGKELPIVAKLFLDPKQSATYHSVWFAERKPMEVEATALFLRSQGLPVVMHSAVPYKGKWIIVSENLQAGGSKMFEAFNFDFSRVKNGEALRRQFG